MVIRIAFAYCLVSLAPESTIADGALTFITDDLQRRHWHFLTTMHFHSMHIPRHLVTLQVAVQQKAGTGR